MMIKKSTMIQPLRARWNAPPENAPWDNNSFATLTRLFRSNAFHIEDPGIDMTSEMYIMCSFDIGLLPKEIEFVKRIKDMGKKFILSFSQDLRFLIGNCLVHESGLHYGELCDYADVILSGVASKIRIYGRNQHKVLDFGVPCERLNFSSKPYEFREIDFLVSNNIGEENWGVATEFLLMLVDKFPSKTIVYSTNLPENKIHPKLRNTVKFVPSGLIYYLGNAKSYINLELRPRPGRSLLESFYFRTPFISCDSTYFSRLFPNHTFDGYDLVKVMELCEDIISTDYNKLISEAERIAEFDYFDNFYPRLLERLYGVGN